MVTNTLYPPNQQHFSDTIIGTVVQRDERFHASSRRMNTTPKRKNTPPPQSTTGRNLLQSDILRYDAFFSKVQKTMTARSIRELEAKHVAEIERRRQRNRTHQARYKMKQRKLVLGLEASVQHLKEEVQDLELQHRVLSYRLPTSGTLWGIAAEYFRLFRHGAQAPALKKLPSTSQSQWDFMQAVMAEDVTDGGVVDPQKLMDKMVLQSRCYQEMDLQPLRMEGRPDHSLIVTTKCTFIITERTLTYGFPHLGNDGKWSPLADKMHGQKSTMRGSVHFMWDSASGRVTRIQWKTDLVTPMLNLLGNLEDVARVFHGAHLSPEGVAMPIYRGCRESHAMEVATHYSTQAARSIMNVGHARIEWLYFCGHRRSFI